MSRVTLESLVWTFNIEELSHQSTQMHVNKQHLDISCVQHTSLFLHVFQLKVLLVLHKYFRFFYVDVYILSDSRTTCQTLSVETCHSGITATEKKENNLNIINISYVTYKILKPPADRGTLEHSRGIESFHFSIDRVTRDGKKNSTSIQNRERLRQK